MYLTKDNQMKLIKDLGLLYPTATSKQRRRCGIYECPDCLIHVQQIANNTDKTSRCKSCAAIHRATTHGESKTRLYRSWKSMRRRCNNPRDKNYKSYGGRGISISEEWSVFTVFKSWAISNGYEEDLSIDRIDNDDGYKPSNCRWTTQEVQTRNTRLLYADNTSGYRGVTASREKWRAQITVSSTIKKLGTFEYKHTAAIVYDSYIINNGLEHTQNFATK